MEKFSFSKLNTFNKNEGGCPFKYKLTYVDKHFISDTSLANEFGTLVHFVEETIATDIINNDNEPNFMIDENKYVDLFLNADIHEGFENILGVNLLKEKYQEEFDIKDKYGFSYKDKAESYLKTGIYRLRNYLTKNKDIKLVAVEKEFNVNFGEGEYVFHGFIDRILMDVTTGEYFIEDIKTWSSSEGHNLVTPLQFVFYALAVEELYGISENQIQCAYDLPIIDKKESAGTKGFIKRGCKKINELLAEIKVGEFEPNPSPLCYYCVFSKTNPKQPEEAKNLCPYYCLWTKTQKNFNCKNEWMGMENHQAVLEAFIEDQNKIQELKEAGKKISELKVIEVKELLKDSSRMFLLRRE